MWQKDCISHHTVVAVYSYTNIIVYKGYFYNVNKAEKYETEFTNFLFFLEKIQSR